MDSKLDGISDFVKSTRNDIEKIFEELNKLHTRVTVLESKKRTTKTDASNN